MAEDSPLFFLIIQNTSSMVSELVFALGCFPVLIDFNNSLADLDVGLSIQAAIKTFESR